MSAEYKRPDAASSQRGYGGLALARTWTQTRTQTRTQAVPVVESAGEDARARMAGEILDASGTGFLLLDVSGDVLLMNALAAKMAGEGDGFQLCGKRLSPLDCSRRLAFRALIAAAGELPGREGAIALARSSRKRPLQVIVRPFHDLGRHGAQPKILMLVTDPERQSHVRASLLHALYGLTPAETEIANSLLTGSSLEEVAAQRRRSVTTVRSQVKTLLSKTETRRQGELICLLSSLPRMVPGATDAMPADNGRSSDRARWRTLNVVGLSRPMNGV